MSESQNVTLTTLASTVAEQTGITKTLATDVTRAFVDALVAAVVAGETVRISGLGTFTKQATQERTGRNPSTGEPLTVPASSRVSFKAAKPFKEAVKAS